MKYVIKIFVSLRDCLINTLEVRYTSPSTYGCVLDRDAVASQYENSPNWFPRRATAHQDQTALENLGGERHSTATL